MRISELSVSNYRAFSGSHSFKFAQNFTVIAGINGRGKTAILDGLASLLSSLLRSLRLIRHNQRTMARSDVYDEADSAKLSMQIDCAGIPLKYGVVYRAEKGRVGATRLSSALREEIVKAYGNPNRGDDQAPLAIYYTTDRAGFRLPKTLPRMLEAGQKLAYPGALSSRIVDYPDLMARYLVWRSLKTSREIRAFDTALKTLLDGFGDLEVTDNPPRLSLRKGAHRLEPGQLSDGERSFLAIIGDLVRRLSLANPELKNPLSGAGVVLIDELELHLHPKWQREVSDKLRTIFPSIQFVATTHSPFIIQSLKPGELINLDPEEFVEYSNKSIEDIAETVMGVALPQKSERYKQMMAAAEEYFRLVRDPKSEAGSVDTALRRLNELSTPFSDDPAFQALLKLEREAHKL